MKFVFVGEGVNVIETLMDIYVLTCTAAENRDGIFSVFLYRRKASATNQKNLVFGFILEHSQ